MPQDQIKELAETAAVENSAMALVNEEMQSANQPQTPVEVPSERPSNRAIRAEVARARSEPYGDKAVPRVVAHRRYGGSSHSRAFLREDLYLYSDRAQIFFERNYERVNMSLIVSTLVTEAIGGVDLAEKISAHIAERFRALEVEMMAALKELKRVANEKNIPEDRQVPAYDNKRNYNPPLHTPHSAQFMTVVTLFDRIVARAEGCWINRIMSPQTRRNLITAWEGKLIKFVRELYDIRTEAIAQARKAGFGRRADTIERTVRQQQNEEKLEVKDVATTDKDDKPDAAPQETAPTETPKRTRTTRSRAKAQATKVEEQPTEQAEVSK